MRDESNIYRFKSFFFQSINVYVDFSIEHFNTKKRRKLHDVEDVSNKIFKMIKTKSKIFKTLRKIVQIFENVATAYHKKLEKSNFISFDLN